MYIPPLVVRGEVGDNETPSDPTDDFFNNAFVVFGNQDVLDGVRSGGRVRVGYWLDDYGIRDAWAACDDMNAWLDAHVGPSTLAPEDAERW